MLPQGVDQNIGQRDIASASLGFGGLEAHPEQLGLLQCLADPDDLGVEVNAAPAQRQHLAEPHAGEQRDHGHGAEPPVAQLGEEGGHVPHNHHFTALDLGRGLLLGDVAAYEVVASRVLEGLAENPVRMADGARGNAATERRMPLLDIDRLELAQDFGPEMRRNLVLEELLIALRRSWRDVPCGLPLGYAAAHEVSHCDLGRLDGGSAVDRGDEPGALNLRLAFGAGEGVPAPFALAGCRIAYINDDGPVAG